MGQTDSENILEFDKLWDYNNPAETEKKFRDVLPRIKDSKNQSAYLQLLTQIARTLGLQMKFDEAHKVLDEAESQLTDKDHLPKIRYFLERGRALNSSKQKDKGKELFLKAYKTASENGEDFYAIDAAHMLGIIEPYEEAQKWNEEAMKLAEKSKDKRANNWLGSLYNNTAWNYHGNNEYEKALKLFEKNVKWHTEKNSLKQLIIAKWCVAKTLRSLNKVDESLKMQQDLLKEAEDKGIHDNGYTYEELAECHLIKGNKEESKKYFKLAYDRLSKDIWLAEYEKERLDRMKAMME
jgi:tetratricopeptide (TPR) repeat protein